MKFNVRVNKYYVSRQIYEELEEDNPAICLLFGMCNYTAGNDTLKQGRHILEDLNHGKLHEIPDYNVSEVTKVDNYTRTGKMKYDLTELAKDGETIGELLFRSFKDVWDMTTKDLNGVIDENTLSLINLISNIDSAMQEAEPEVFEDNFGKLMKRYDWTEVETEYLRDKKLHTVSMKWLQERQERELQKVLEMDIMHYADDPSTEAIENSDYSYHLRFLSHKFKDNPDYQEAYTKFMEYATRQEGLILPKLGEYGKYIAINFNKFRPEQQKALYAIIRKLELIHADMVKRKPELGKYLGSHQGTLENTKLFAPYFHIKEMLKGEWFKRLRADDRYNDRWADTFAEALIRSEYGCQIADEWKERSKQIKGYVIGCLKEAGVFRRDISNDQIASEVGIMENHRSFGKYIGKESQEQPYAEWILKHVDDGC